MVSNRSRTAGLAILAAGLIGGAAPYSVAGVSRRPVSAPKYIILLISDGAGFNSFHAASYYEHGELGQQVYDAFPVRMGCTTYMLNYDGVEQGYDSELMWTDFNYVKGDDDYTAFTDSAAAATALCTGVKTRKYRISTDINGVWLTTIAELADAAGLATGVVTSVPISHATPACVWAHNPTRYNYTGIANEMIYESGLDVILGCGHPLFGDNGLPRAAGSQTYKYVGGATTFNALVSGTTGLGWTFIEEREDFEAIAEDPELAPERLIGIAQVHQTLQFNRPGSGMGNPLDTVPTLETMTRAALNTLSWDPDGFFLMVEGGAVDWANHDHDLGRMIEEQMDFNASVAAAVDWVEAHSNWSEALVIVTADHECGMLWGPGSYTDVDGDEYFDAEVDVFNDWNSIANNGAGVLPGVQYGSYGHTNALVPVYAKGKGANELRKLSDGRDREAAWFWGFPNGRYVDNTDVFTLMSGSVEASVPLQRFINVGAGSGAPY